MVSHTDAALSRLPATALPGRLPECWEHGIVRGETPEGDKWKLINDTFIIFTSILSSISAHVSSGPPAVKGQRLQCVGKGSHKKMSNKENTLVEWSLATAASICRNIQVKLPTMMIKFVAVNI